MVAWRSLLGLVLVLIATPALWADTYPLAEEVKAGDCCRYKLEMTLSGELRFYKDEKFVPVKLTAKATHQFPERVLATGKNGLAERTARVYDSAAVEITVGGNRSERSLRKERSLVAAQRISDVGLSYSPSGPLTREEIEALDHFDTLSVTGLLAGKSVAVGDTWKPNNAVLQALCHFEGLAEQDVSCKLESVKDNVAHVTITGTAQGIELGALVKVQVDATCRFDLTQKRIVHVAWKQKDERDQGPASPASTVETSWKVERTPIEQPDSLGDVALVSVPEGEVPATMLAVDYRDPKSRYTLPLPREWQLVSQTDEHVIFRLMERGDFVAQVTVTPWKSAGKGQHMSPEEFREAMARTPGWEPEKEVEIGEVKTAAGGNYIYRASYVGTMDGTEVAQNFYLVAGPDGEQVVLLFTMTPKKAQKLAERDMFLATAIEFPSNKKTK
jgi:hypothetical protein